MVPCVLTVLVITTAQLHSIKPGLKFCAGSSPACGVSKICDIEDLCLRIVSDKMDNQKYENQAKSDKTKIICFCVSFCARPLLPKMNFLRGY